MFAVKPFSKAIAILLMPLMALAAYGVVSIDSSDSSYNSIYNKEAPSDLSIHSPISIQSANARYQRGSLHYDDLLLALKQRNHQ